MPHIQNSNLNNKCSGSEITVVDLFCGAGGLSYGLRQAGFDIVLAIDKKRSAIETYRENLGSHVLHEDISEETNLPQVSLIAGGPPCQGFSSAGLRTGNDRRNTLVSVFAKLVARHRPLAFVFENVEGFLTAERGQRVLDLLEPLVGAGYRIHVKKINAANYGVPQLRKRVIVIGGLGWDPLFPGPVFKAYGGPGAQLAGRRLRSAPTLVEALEGLPTPSDSEPGDPSGHFSTPLNGLDFQRIRNLGPGQTMKDLPQDLWHKSYRRRAFRRVMDGTPSERRGGPPAGIRRLQPDEPSKTITGAATAEFVHPTEDRYLTLRESARLQSFPDTYRFVGSVAERAQLIGDAVPPLLASLVGQSLWLGLRNQTSHIDEGALLSFVPTLSTGMSPALRYTKEKVFSTFGSMIKEQRQPGLWL